MQTYPVYRAGQRIANLTENEIREWQIIYGTRLDIRKSHRGNLKSATIRTPANSMFSLATATFSRSVQVELETLDDGHQCYNLTNARLS